MGKPVGGSGIRKMLIAVSAEEIDEISECMKIGKYRVRTEFIREGIRLKCQQVREHEAKLARTRATGDA